MANWFDNTLVIYGPGHLVKDFVARARRQMPEITDRNLRTGRLEREHSYEQPLDFEAFLPPPEALGIGAVLEWQNVNWGCKRGACDANVTVQECNSRAYARYVFQTENSPPGSFVSAVAKMNPELTFHLRYSEFTLNCRG